MARRGGKQHNGVIAWASLFAFPIYFITQHDWLRAAPFLSIILAIPCWYYAIKMPTKCRVTFTATGRPCQNPAYGAIFGCRGQNHYWPKALARIGKHQQNVEQSPASDRMRRGGHTGFGAHGPAKEVVTVRIEGNVKNDMTFYFMVLTTVCTVVTTVGSLVS